MTSRLPPRQPDARSAWTTPTASHDTATPKETTVDLHYADGIAAARTTLALQAREPT